MVLLIRKGTVNGLPEWVHIRKAGRALVLRMA
jgi:hypothetical protein